MEKQNIILASGGTGGHIFPACALAKELGKRNHNAILVTDYRYKQYNKDNDNFIVKTILSATPYQRGIHRIIALFKILIGVVQALLILIKYKTKLIVGFGGYPAFPTLFAARILKVPIIIHEQNSAIGRSNKYFTKFAKFIATSFVNTAGINHLDSTKIILTGNPIRDEIITIGRDPYPELDDKLNILIIGGSQGAHIFSNLIPDALKTLSFEKQNKIRVIQQCRKEDLQLVKDKYKDSNIETILASFFSDIPERLKQSHLVISRAGASTIAELKLAARPAIIVPITSSFENHQLHNARSFVEDKVGWIMVQENFTIQNIASQIEKFIDQPALLKEAAANFKNQDSAAVLKLADLVESNLKI